MAFLFLEDGLLSQEAYERAFLFNSRRTAAFFFSQLSPLFVQRISSAMRWVAGLHAKYRF